MSARHRTVSVTTAATPLNNTSDSGDHIAGSSAAIYNDGAVVVFVGGDNVTATGATKGMPLAPAEQLSVDGQGDILYGIVATGTCNVIVVEVGVA